ncbi:MAG: c-type cytochrome biogenesis protein CcsB [Candidatus Magnetomorum sp.]|nr:c-type cytochrome biogenesis protein CcsB [Candidatus Magnetomorum sp.]
MTSSLALSITTFIYGAAASAYICGWIFKKNFMNHSGTFLTIMALAINTVGISLRWIESYELGIGHAPLSNLYESLVFFSWTIAAIYLSIEYRYKNKTIGAFAMPLAFMSLAYASLPSINNDIQPLIPALKSNWLIAHVFTCFLGYAGFAVAFGLSTMFLMKSKDTSRFSHLLPDDTMIDELTYQMIMFGFLFLTAGIITGAVWANSAWGAYWSWDPKETWSLITWFIYATVIHARLMRGWSGRRIAWISILGFCAVLFTYFGVNLLPGLHSYGK